LLRLSGTLLLIANFAACSGSSEMPPALGDNGYGGSTGTKDASAGSAGAGGSDMEPIPDGTGGSSIPETSTSHDAGPDVDAKGQPADASNDADAAPPQDVSTDVRLADVSQDSPDGTTVDATLDAPQDTSDARDATEDRTEVGASDAPTEAGASDALSGGSRNSG
jgi:hypothetical protein